jgi:cell division GTPase FtsZ
VWAENPLANILSRVAKEAEELELGIVLRPAHFNGGN